MTAKKRKKQNIVVIGDVSIDNIMIPKEPDNSGAGNGTRWNGDNEKHLETFTLPGGALLIRDIVKIQTETTGGVDVISYRENEAGELPAGEMIQTLSEGGMIQNKEYYMIKNFLGYTVRGFGDGAPSFTRNFTFESPGNVDVIVVNDPGYGFRNVENAWTTVINKAEKNKKAVIIYTMAGELFAGKLWERISQLDLLSRTIVVIEADDLRKTGVNISRRLSWDRTIADFITVLAYQKHDRLEKCPHILVRFGLEGVMYYYHSGGKGKEKQRKSYMFYTPNQCEDDTAAENQGKMIGLNSTFIGFLAGEISKVTGTKKNMLEIIKAVVPTTAERVIRVFKSGYRKENNLLQYPFKEVLSEPPTVLFKNLDLDVPDTGYLESSRKQWCILSDQIPLDYHLRDIAMEYVVHGKADSLENVPVAQFGKLKTVDKNEIENFRGIKNLIKDYLDDDKDNKPLSIAVFGPPGSGKSFAVKSVAKSVMGGMEKKAKILEYNLSQFESPLDIIRAFHEVRDHALTGTAPLVFFDEFDSTYQNRRLGWLKYFLAPMQDGEFKEGETTHPVGRAIFVFAGGTHRSLEEFARESDVQKQDNGDDLQQFIAAKGPDFVSRLKGFVNILGPNPIDKDSHRDTSPRCDRFFIIRRAVLLRALLLQQKSIISRDGKNTIRIDEDVLRALLLIPKYNHGARSMNAIINMSMLKGRDCFEKAALPSPEQLGLHVAPFVFMNILDRDLIIKKASIARAIHDTYRADQIKKNDDRAKNQASVVTWEELSEERKQNNHMLAKNISFYLLLINCTYRPIDKKMPQDNPFESFSEDETDYLAQMAHERWKFEKESKGWVYGKQRDDEKKIHDCIVPWKKLPETLKSIDRNTIKSLPRILGEVNFEIYRLQ